MKDFKALSAQLVCGVLVLVIGLGLVTGTSLAQQKSSIIEREGRLKTKVPAVKKEQGRYVQVPELTGKSLAEAKKELARAGLRPGKVFSIPGRRKPGAVVRQKPRGRTKAVRGARVELWVQQERSSLRAGHTRQKAEKITPRIVQKGRKVFLEFPGTVRDVSISDSQGSRLQQFKKGQRFDITRSAVMTKAGRIRVAFRPGPGKVFSPSPQRLRYLSLSRMVDPEFIEAAVIAMADEDVIESGEPANDAISGATPVNTGSYSGFVGSDDEDYLKITAGPGNFGSVFTVKAASGDVQLELYGPQESYLTGGAGQVWIALKPNTSAYVLVRPSVSGTTEYCVSIYSKDIADSCEPNDTISQAKNIIHQSPFLCNVLDSAGSSVGVKDWYNLNLQQACDLEIEVSISGFQGDVTIYLYEPGSDSSSSHLAMEHGGSNGATLAEDLSSYYWPEYADPDYPFPPGNWKVLVTSFAGAGSPLPYGTGPYPVCYIQGYSLQVRTN